MSKTAKVQAGGKPRSGRKVPSWLVAVVALVTAGGTVWAMLQRDTAGSWTGDSAFQPDHVTRVLYPGVAALNQAPGTQQPHQNGNGFRFIARPMAGGAPVISMSATMPHADRGPCTHCHTVVSNQGKSMPRISAVAQMPHRYYGGVCANCHLTNSQSPRGNPGGKPGTTVAGGAGWPTQAQGVANPNWQRQQGRGLGQGQMQMQRPGQPQQMRPHVQPHAQQPHTQQRWPQGAQQAWGNQNAGQWQANNQRSRGFRALAAPGGQTPQNPQLNRMGAPPARAPQQAAPVPPKKPVEVEWLGLEVAPITTVTAAQFGIPPGIKGIIISDAEAQAAVAGLKAGDVLVAINGRIIPNMATYNQVVQLGKLNWGMVEVQRKGKTIRVPLRKIAPAPRTPGQMAPGQMVPGQRVPQPPVMGGNPQAFTPGTLQGAVPGQPVGLRRNAGSASQGF